MPSTVVDFTPSTAAPAAVTAPAYTGTTVAPAACALPATVGTPDAAAPSGVTPPTFTGDVAAPVAIAVAGLAPDATPPAGITAPAYAGTVAIPETLALAAPTTPTANVPQIVGYADTLPAPTDATMHTPALIFAGRLTAAQLFGFYKAPAAIVIKGVQLFAQTIPTGSDVVIELVDSDGISLGRTATLPAGLAFADVTFVTPLPLAVNTLVRAKVNAVGSTNPGGSLTANLIVQLA